MMKKICVVGSINMDMVVMTDRFPHPGETVIGKEFHTFPGGKGPIRRLLLEDCKRMYG